MIQIHIQLENDLDIVIDEKNFHEKITLSNIVETILSKVIAKKINVPDSKDRVVLQKGDRVPLLPAQKNFLIKFHQDPSSYVVILNIRCPALVDIKTLEMVLKRIVAEHSIFSMRFKQENNKWIQFYQGYDESLKFNSYSMLEKKGVKEKIEKQNNELVSLFDIENGPVFIVRHYRTNIFEADTLQITINHLYTDYFSIYMLIKKMEKYYFDETMKKDEIQDMNNCDNYIPFALTHGQFDEKNISKKSIFVKNEQFPQKHINISYEQMELTKEETMDLYAGYTTNKERHNLFLTILLHGLEIIDDLKIEYIELTNHYRHNDKMDLRNTMGWIASSYVVKNNLPKNLNIHDKYIFINKEINSFNVYDKIKETNNNDNVDSKVKFSYRSNIDDFSELNGRFKCYDVRLPTQFINYDIGFYVSRVNSQEIWSIEWNIEKFSQTLIELFLQNCKVSLVELIYAL